MPHPTPGHQRLALRRRRAFGLLALALMLALLVILSMVVGSKNTSVSQVTEAWPTGWEILRGRLTTAEAAADGTAPQVAEIAGILATMRIPRTILAILIGIALGLAGTIIQALTRNPLADPGILGVSSGAALAVVTGTFLLGMTSMTHHLILGFLGAGLAALIVFGISAAGIGGGKTLTLVLTGSALAAVMSAMTSAIVYIDPNALDTLRFWQAGSVTGRGFDIIVPTLAPLAAGILLALALGPTLNVLTLGAETAQALGTDVARANALGLLAITLLAGAATAAAGPIAFIGLVVPHLARMITGPDNKWVLPYAALTGACLLLAADLLGRIVMRPGELQAGIVIALLGAPAFIWLVRHRSVVSL